MADKWCKTCWNLVDPLPEAKKVIGKGGDKYKWYHRVGSLHQCDKMQLTDSDVIEENPNLQPA